VVVVVTNEFSVVCFDLQNGAAAAEVMVGQ
jgi:hypothetical protein